MDIQGDLADEELASTIYFFGWHLHWEAGLTSLRHHSGCRRRKGGLLVHCFVFVLVVLGSVWGDSRMLYYNLYLSITLVLKYPPSSNHMVPLFCSDLIPLFNTNNFKLKCSVALSSSPPLFSALLLFTSSLGLSLDIFLNSINSLKRTSTTQCPLLAIPIGPI